MIRAILFAFLPSPVKIWLLRMRGHSIGRGCHIGLSIVSADRIEMGDHAYIGNFNLLWRMREIRIGRGSRISFLNWIAGGRVGTFTMGANSSMSSRHMMDTTGGFSIGDNTIIAGMGSHFYSHGQTPHDTNLRAPITIGSWCYVGSDVRMTPGSSVGDHCFVGMGAVINKPFTETHALLAGVPARKVKDLPQDAAFFNRPYISHRHHPRGYQG